MKKILLFVLMMVCTRVIAQTHLPDSLAAQKKPAGTMDVKGKITDADENHKLAGVHIEIYRNDTLTCDTTSNSKGIFHTKKYKVGNVYKMKFSKPGYSTKMIVIDTRYIPDEFIWESHPMQLDLSMFHISENCNANFLENLIYARCSYNPETNELEWDMPYIMATKQKIEELRAQNNCE